MSGHDGKCKAPCTLLDWGSCPGTRWSTTGRTCRGRGLRGRGCWSGRLSVFCPGPPALREVSSLAWLVWVSLSKVSCVTAPLSYYACRVESGEWEWNTWLPPCHLTDAQHSMSVSFMIVIRLSCPLSCCSSYSNNKAFIEEQRSHICSYGYLVLLLCLLVKTKINVVVSQKN